MAKYIDRAKAVAELTLIGARAPDSKLRTVARCISAVELLPLADVAEVRHGRWLSGAENFSCGNYNAECSACHCYISWAGCDEDFNYCPNCGTKMDEPYGSKSCSEEGTQ